MLSMKWKIQINKLATAVTIIMEFDIVWKSGFKHLRYVFQYQQGF